MKVAVMQPYFFPAISYFQLMNYVDLWVIFDDIQYIDKGWINRNRVLHPNIDKGWQYFTIPLSNKKQFSKINELEINQSNNWKADILGKLSIYKKAPYSKETIDFVRDCLSEDEERLSKYIQKVLVKTKDRLGITTEVIDQVNVDHKKILHSGSWALEISKAVNASEYVNPYSGYSIFIEDEFLQSNLSLKFLKKDEFKYKQYRPTFENNLSIIDILMWNSLEDVRSILLNKFHLYDMNELKKELGF